MEFAKPIIYRNKSKVITIAAALFIIWCVMHSKEFLIPIFVASLLALLMNPIVNFVRKAKLPEALSVTLAVLILYLPLIGLASLILIEGDSLVKSWPQIYASAKQSIGNFGELSIFGIKPSTYMSLEEIQTELSTRAGESAVILLAGLKSLLSAGTSTLLVLSFAAVMLYSRNHLKKSVDRIVSVEENPEAAKILDSALDVIQSFLVARVLIVAAVGIADFIILELFRVPYAIILSVVLGISTLIPVVGFFIGIIPPLIVALSLGHSLIYTAALTGCIFAISSAQDHFLTPMLIGRKLNLNFLATYFALFAGEQMWGLWGMFLSIPALGLIRVLLSASKAYEPWAMLLEEEEANPNVVARKVEEAQYQN